MQGIRSLGWCRTRYGYLGDDTLCPDTLPLDQHRQLGRTVDTVPASSLKWRGQHRENATHMIYVRCDSLKSRIPWWSQGTAWLLPTFKRHLPNRLLLPDDLGHSVSLAVHRSHGITYDPVFAAGDQVSHYMGVLLLIFLTASIKCWFITCRQTPLQFGPQGRDHRWEKTKLKWPDKISLRNKNKWVSWNQIRIICR